MKFWKRAAYKLAYHVFYPLLRFYRIYILSPRDSARAILVHKNELMLVHNIGTRRWSLPGGTLEKGETPEQCVMRELMEELKITDATIDYKLGAYHSMHHGEQVWVHVFVVQATSFFHKRQWEIDRAEWFALRDIPSTLSPATSRRIGDYKNGLRETENFW